MTEAGAVAGPARVRRPRQETALRREEILRAAMATFGAKGFHRGSLVEVAEQVGMTHAGVLHHFGSKDQLLLEVLEHHGRSGLEPAGSSRQPTGLSLFRELVATARADVAHPGTVRAYAVLSAESLTEDHPGQAWFRSHYRDLRALLVESLGQGCDPDRRPPDAELEAAAGAIIAVLDGLRVQWLLDPDAVDLARSAALAIEAIVAAVVAGREGGAVL